MDYNEEENIAALLDYVKSTYGAHYATDGGDQTIDAIFASGHGEGFCVGNIIKYASRYGKKNGKNRDDLMKIMHYTLLAMHVLEKEVDVSS